MSEATISKILDDLRLDYRDNERDIRKYSEKLVDLMAERLRIERGIREAEEHLEKLSGASRKGTI